MLTLASMLRGSDTEAPIEDRPMSRIERLREMLASRNRSAPSAQPPSSDPSKQPAMTSMMGPGSLDSLPPGLMAILAARMGANMGERNDNDRPSLMGGAFGKGG